MIRAALLVFLFCGLQLKAAVIPRAVHINTGQFRTVDTSYFFYQAFNPDTIFSQKSMVIRAEQGDSLVLSVYNHDSVQHGFHIPGKGSLVIPAGGTATLGLNLGAEEALPFYDHLQMPRGMYLGLGGMIAVTAKGRLAHAFTWNLREHQVAWNQNPASINPAQYRPDYFTINGLSFPDVENDNTATIEGNVGDTLLLFMVNTGLSVHSIHFHGYHGRVLSTSSKRMRIGWIKDTFPIESTEAVLIEIMPDKPGVFPVHDHNLIAIQGKGKYPNGMLVMMHVQ